MRCLVALSLLLFASAPALADRTKPTEATCKRVVVGRGLERHVVCQFEAPVIVKTGPPRPNVLIVHRDPRVVVGPPRSSDRLAGLSHHLD